ncbi:NAD(P)-dependent alcohol dehydrogenase [Marisediminicola senii]|uniref:NAD(P)-dependent alcohol dehydrogenase n=1 Tax=Marisediminicola senii TaxID=2711233 RepID=UPI0013EBBA37|nr:NAD(P)-dependent alcohol dehydrogenase [Marisediminicola senii]
MRAWVYERYGSVAGLELRDVPMPSPATGEVLVEVACTSVNLSDWEGLRGTPAYARLSGGLRRPRRTTLGSDIAGVVAAVGDGVTAFRAGDAVFGDNLPRNGGFAEFVAMPQTALAPMPPALTFAVASAIPQAGAIATQSVALATPGDRVLIIGAGGGSGSLAVQLAVATGVRVTAVDNAGKLDHLRSLGAHDVIDYRLVDPTRTGPYELIIDMVAYRSVLAYRRALARGGRYAMVGGTARALVRMLTVGTVVGAASGVRLGLLVVHEGPAHFVPLANRVAAGEVAVHIGREFAFDDVPAALAFHGEGRANGKVVVRVREA